MSLWDNIPHVATRRPLTALRNFVARPFLDPDEAEDRKTVQESEGEKPKPYSDPTGVWGRHASELIGKAQGVEPVVTQFLDRLGDKNHAHLEGLEQRLKSKDSLLRKMQAENPDPVSAKGKISDALRYTYVIQPEHYTSSVKGMLHGLEDGGFKLRTKNLWQPGNAYMGLNVAIHTPEEHGSFPFEVQFQTPESLKNKRDIHPLYEKFRVSQDNTVRRSLFQKMLKKTDRIQIPGGIEGLPTEVHRPYEDLPAMTAH